jgi:uncharacterized membrane protein YfcA
MFCGVAGVIGAVLGSLLIQKVPDAYARKAFAVFLIYSAWKLWAK